jgi:hypothetical protein
VDENGLLGLDLRCPICKESFTHINLWAVDENGLLGLDLRCPICKESQEMMFLPAHIFVDCRMLLELRLGGDMPRIFGMLESFCDVGWTRDVRSLYLYNMLLGGSFRNDTGALWWTRGNRSRIVGDGLAEDGLVSVPAIAIMKYLRAIFIRCKQNAE